MYYFSIFRTVLGHHIILCQNFEGSEEQFWSHKLPKLLLEGEDIAKFDFNLVDALVMYMLTLLNLMLESKIDRREVIVYYNHIWR